MKLVIFLGPPGVGKGTQCSFLSSRLGFKHISTGAIIRKEIQSQSELGLRVKNLVEAGNLVDDKTIFLCLESALSKLNCLASETILLDGLPRNLSQGRDLDVLIAKMAFEKVQVICFDASVETLVKRCENRFVCSACGGVESISVQHEDLAVLASYKCHSCGKVGSMSRRKDDEPATVRRRHELYLNETLPLVSFYRDKNMISFVDALMPPEFVYVRVASCLV